MTRVSIFHNHWIILHNSKICCAVLSYVVLCCVTLCYVALCCATLSYVALCCAVLSYVVPCCAMLLFTYVVPCCLISLYVVLSSVMLSYVALSLRWAMLCYEWMPWQKHRQTSASHSLDKVQRWQSYYIQLIDIWQMAFPLHSQWNIMEPVTVQMPAKLETYVSDQNVSLCYFPEALNEY